MYPPTLLPPALGRAAASGRLCRRGLVRWRLPLWAAAAAVLAGVSVFQGVAWADPFASVASGGVAGTVGPVGPVGNSGAEVPSEPLTLERVKARYAGLTRLQADVEQTRTGKHLLKPFVSEIRLDYTPGAITWSYVRPFQKSIKMTRDGFEMGEKKLPPAHSERLKSLSSMLDSLFRMDLEAIRKDFDLKVTGDVVGATPKDDSPLKFVQTMNFEFDKKLDILSVTVATERDSAVMKFSNIRIEK